MRRVNFAIGEILRLTRKKGDAWRKHFVDGSRLHMSQPATGGPVKFSPLVPRCCWPSPALRLPAASHGAAGPGTWRREPRATSSTRSWKRCLPGATSTARRSNSTSWTKPKSSKFWVRGGRRCTGANGNSRGTFATGCTCEARCASTAYGHRGGGAAALRGALARARAEQQLKPAPRRREGRFRDRHLAGRHSRWIRPGSPLEPRFVSEAYFMDFKFDPGNYYLAGRKSSKARRCSRSSTTRRACFQTMTTRDGDKQDAIATRTPTKAASQPHGADDTKEKDFERTIERRMNKTALITLWVDPTEHQIVKYTFDNVWLDFLPVAWLVRVDDMHASMTMGQPFPGIWLPRNMNIHAGVTLANGSYEAGYGRVFSDYREADVKSTDSYPEGKSSFRIGFVPGGFCTAKVLAHWVARPTPFFTTGSPQPCGDRRRNPRPRQCAPDRRGRDSSWRGCRWAAHCRRRDSTRFEQRLKDSGRFETVEVRKRYRSLTDMSDVALVLLVHERPGCVRSMTARASSTTRSGG